MRPEGVGDGVGDGGGDGVGDGGGDGGKVGNGGMRLAGHVDWLTPPKFEQLLGLVVQI